jgi:hypothetical protein
LDIHFTVRSSGERAAPLAEKNAAERHHILRSLISLNTKTKWGVTALFFSGKTLHTKKIKSIH